MKGYSATMVIGIIVAVIIAVFILYIAWAKGLLPFSRATSEAQCKAYFSEECQRSAELGWDPSVFTNVKGCKSYVSNAEAFDCCVNNVGCWEYDTRSDACRDMCSEFVG